MSSRVYPEHGGGSSPPPKRHARVHRENVQSKIKEGVQEPESRNRVVKGLLGVLMKQETNVATVFRAIFTRPYRDRGYMSQGRLSTVDRTGQGPNEQKKILAYNTLHRKQTYSSWWQVGRRIRIGRRDASISLLRLRVSALRERRSFARRSRNTSNHGLRKVGWSIIAQRHPSIRTRHRRRRRPRLPKAAIAFRRQLEFTRMTTRHLCIRVWRSSRLVERRQDWLFLIRTSTHDARVVPVSSVSARIIVRIRRTG